MNLDAWKKFGCWDLVRCGTITTKVEGSHHCGYHLHPNGPMFDYKVTISGCERLDANNFVIDNNRIHAMAQRCFDEHPTSSCEAHAQHLGATVCTALDPLGWDSITVEVSAHGGDTKISWHRSATG